MKNKYINNTPRVRGVLSPSSSSSSSSKPIDRIFFKLEIKKNTLYWGGRRRSWHCRCVARDTSASRVPVVVVVAHCHCWACGGGVVVVVVEPVVVVVSLSSLSSLSSLWSVVDDVDCCWCVVAWRSHGRVDFISQNLHIWKCQWMGELGQLRYAALTEIQQPRVGIIESLQKMMERAFR